MENPDETNFTARLQQRITYGETLPDGTVVDLVQTAGRDGPSLLSWGRYGMGIRSAIDCGGISYRPPTLHRSILDAIRFPSGAAEYGTIRELFLKVAGACRQHLRLPEDLAAFATCWILSTWIPELVLIPFTLCIFAPFLQVFSVLRVLGALCRRALLVAELNRNLPLFVEPTLLVNDPSLEEETCDLWRAANCRGLFVAGDKSTLRSLRCTKAVILQPDKPLDTWGPESMSLVLPHSDFPPLSDSQLADLAVEFQPWLEMFRLRLLSGAEPFVSKSHPLARFELVRHLGPCIPEDGEIVRLLTPLLELHQQELTGWGTRDPGVASLKSVWTPLHQQKEMSVDEITTRDNAILRSFGEMYEYNTREIGRRLANLKLVTTSNGQRKVLRFSGENRLRIHQCVREFGLQLPFFDDCPDCKRLQATEQKPVE
ncbi:MAG: hypothetical protein WBX03_00840 [Terriglobales bacterium]